MLTLHWQYSLDLSRSNGLLEPFTLKLTVNKFRSTLYLTTAWQHFFLALHAYLIILFNLFCLDYVNL